MKKFRALLTALALVISMVCIGAVNVPTASAALATCYQGGQYYPTPPRPGTFQPIPYFATNAGIICFASGAGGGSVRIVLTCKYELYYASHTYNVYGNWASVGNWSWASCGDHYDSYNYPDYIIHICPQMSVGTSAWPSSYCF